MDFLGQGRLEKKRILIMTDGEQLRRRRRDPCTRRGLRPRLHAAAQQDAHAGDARDRRRTGHRVWLEADEARQLRGRHSGGPRRPVRTRCRALTRAARPTGCPKTSPCAGSRSICPQEEFRRPEADRETLEELAGSAERFVTLADIESLVPRIPPGMLNVTHARSTHSVWNTRFMLILLGLLLLAEWTVRKLYHMM